MSLPRHIRNYLSFFGYDQNSFIECECGCGRQGLDFHHLIPRSKFGSKRKAEQDRVDNVACISIECHEKAGASRQFNEELKLKHRRNLLACKHVQNDLEKYLPEV